MTGEVASLITTLLALALAIHQGRAWLRRAKPSSFWWAMAFLLTALAAGTQFASYRWGWSPTLYRLYLVAAAFIPAYMGVGTAYLLLRSFWAGITLLVVGLLSLGMIYYTATAAVPMAGLHAGVAAAAGQNLPAALTVFFAVLGSLGSLLLIGGALVSWWQRRDPRTLLIAIGGAVFASGGSLAGLGIPALFYASEIVGILLLFAGIVGYRRSR